MILFDETNPTEVYEVTDPIEVHKITEVTPVCLNARRVAKLNPKQYSRWNIMKIVNCN